MTIHVNIGAAKTQLSKLIRAALRGEEVVLDRDGKPQVRLVPVPEAKGAERERLAAKRRAFFGSWAKAFEGYDTDIGPSMTDEEVEERWKRKFGPAT
jgi:antitoxin (DNA-binding transcriptional repressor) of toxin-antitoxin stability system